LGPRCFALGLAAIVATIAAEARAQPTVEAQPQAPPGAEPTSAREPPADSATVAPVPSAADPNVAANNAAVVAELTRRLSALEAKQAEAEAAALLTAPSEADDIKREPLKIYGFADFGAQRIWFKKVSILRDLLETDTTTFVIGNLNLYFDAQPVEHWRTLIEIRFTNAPHGQVNNYGGLAGTFNRESTQQYDPNATVVNSTMWRGSTVIERAWIEWNELQSLKLRLGNWFTPFGIWNEDHGSPTLIGMGLPQFLVQAWMPIRQTGVMAYGSTFASDWELAYALTFSNGRQELSNFNFGDTFGYGGRVFARREAGDLNTTFGLSFYAGSDSDQTVNLRGFDPLRFDTQKTWEYTEYVAGADVAVDIGSTRVRAEGALRRQVFTEGKRLPANPALAPGGLLGDRWMTSVYLLAAHELPWGGLEPYVMAEIAQAPSPIGPTIPDGVLSVSLGFNWHINPAITWKNQILRAGFFDWLYESTTKPGTDNTTTIYTRLVMAF
jgi:hypothetical protein